MYTSDFERSQKNPISVQVNKDRRCHTVFILTIFWALDKKFELFGYILHGLKKYFIIRPALTFLRKLWYYGSMWNFCIVDLIACCWHLMKKVSKIIYNYILLFRYSDWKSNYKLWVFDIWLIITEPELNEDSPLTPDRCQVERPPPSLQITSNFLVFMGFHVVPLLKRRV